MQYVHKGGLKPDSFHFHFISHNIPNVIDWLLNEIREKFFTHSFLGFVLYTCIYFIIMYQKQSVIKNCYVCNR